MAGSRDLNFAINSSKIIESSEKQLEEARKENSKVTFMQLMRTLITCVGNISFETDNSRIIKYNNIINTTMELCINKLKDSCNQAKHDDLKSWEDIKSQKDSLNTLFELPIASKFAEEFKNKITQINTLYEEKAPAAAKVSQESSFKNQPLVFEIQENEMREKAKLRNTQIEKIIDTIIYLQIIMNPDKMSLLDQAKIKTIGSNRYKDINVILKSISESKKTSEEILDSLHFLRLSIMAEPSTGGIGGLMEKIKEKLNGLPDKLEPNPYAKFEDTPTTAPRPKK
jgi:hypothetical protein